MDRRELFKGAVAVPLAAAFAWPGLGQAAQRTLKRVRPSNPAWPSAAQWDELKRQVGGNLIVPKPLAADCMADPAGDACVLLRKDLRSPYYIGDQAAGTQTLRAGWTPGLPPSAYAVAAHSAADVVAAVNFAREHRLRLVVKGGGHSYQGTSNAADSLLVWTRAMNAIELHDGFVPKGSDAAPTPAVSVETGAMWIDAYEAVTTKGGRYVQGGGCASVGVAGLVHGGGFGSFSKGFGTAAASLLEAEIVTADGVLRTVNDHADPELFWAIKGGGGGSFGVLTRLTLRTSTTCRRTFGIASMTIKAASDEAFRRLLAAFVGHYADHLFNPHWGESVQIRPDNVLKVNMVSQGLDNAGASAAWQPFVQWLGTQTDITLVGRVVFSFDARGWRDSEAKIKQGSMLGDTRPGASPQHGWWTGDADQVGVFLHGYESVWLPESLLAGEGRERLAAALLEASRKQTVELHFNKGLAGAPPEAIEASRRTATNPAVLDAFALAIMGAGGPPIYPGLPGPGPDLAAAHRDAAEIDEAAAALRKIAPDAGSYCSESNYFNPAWREAFWGPNYPRLRAAKAKYDPDGLFVVHHGVGSEDWSPDGFTRL